MQNTICTFCSLGCGLKIETLYGCARSTVYDRENPLNHGALCPRGNYVLEVLTHPKRLAYPQAGKKQISWQEAYQTMLEKIKGLDAGQIGVIASSHLPCEDLFAVAKLAEEVLQNSNFEITRASAEPEDSLALPVLQPEALGELDTLLIIGDPLAHSPVLSQYLNQVKYGNRKNKIMVIDTKETHTSWFATDFVKIDPGTEIEFLCALAKDKNTSEKAMRLISALKQSPALGTIVSLPQDQPIITRLARLICSRFSGSRGVLPLYTLGNALGAKKILGQVQSSAVVQKLLGGELKALFLFGEDLLASYPGEETQKAFLGLSLLATADLFENASSHLSRLSLPLCSYLETTSTFILSGEKIKTLEPVVSPLAQSKPVRQMVQELGSLLKPGWQLSFSLLDAWLKTKSSKTISAEELLRMAEGKKGHPRAELTLNPAFMRNFAWARIKG